MYPDVTTIVLQSLNSTLNISFGHDDVKSWPTGVLEALLKANVLRQSDYARTVLCRECPDECSVEIRFANGVDGGEPWAYFDCPCRDDIGRIWVPSDDLSTYSPSPAGLAALLANALDGRLEELISGRLWMVGRPNIAGTRALVLLARGLDWLDSDRVIRETRSHARNQQAVLIVPKMIESDIASDGSMVLVPLDDMLYLDHKGLIVDISMVLQAAEQMQMLVANALNNRLKECRYLFRKGSDTWVIIYDEVEVYPPLKNAKGLNYLALLLENPNTEYYASQIIHQVDGLIYEPDEIHMSMSNEALGEYDISVSVFTDAGEIMDSAYEKDCRDQLKKSQNRLRDAEISKDANGIRQAKKEIEQYRRALNEGIGMGGRHRATGNPLEKARSSVTQNIKRVLKKLKEQHPALYEHLSASLQTGTKCSYSPSSPINWKF